MAVVACAVLGLTTACQPGDIESSARPGDNDATTPAAQSLDVENEAYHGWLRDHGHRPSQRPASSRPTTTPASTSTTPRTTAPTTAPTTTPTTPPPPPASGSRGLPAGVALKASGSITVTQDGAVVEGADVAGTLEIRAKNVIVRNSRLTGNGGSYGILVQPGGSATVDHVLIQGNYSTAGFRGANLTLTNSEITGMTADAGKVENNNTIRNNVFHNFAPGAGAHSDGLQLETPAGNVTIIGNTITMPGKGTSAVNNTTGALFIVPQLAGSYGSRAAGPIVVRDNVLGGGATTTHFDSAQYPLTDLHVVNNTFLPDALYESVYDSGYEPAEWSGNRMQNGQAVPPPA